MSFFFFRFAHLFSRAVRSLSLFSLSKTKPLRLSLPSLEHPRGPPAGRHLHQRVRGRGGGTRGERRRRRSWFFRFRRRFRRSRGRRRALSASTSTAAAAPSRGQVRLPDGDHGRARVRVPQQARRRVHLQQRPRLLEKCRFPAAGHDDVKEVEPQGCPRRRVHPAADQVPHHDVGVVPEGVGGQEDAPAGVAQGPDFFFFFLNEK